MAKKQTENRRYPAVRHPAARMRVLLCSVFFCLCTVLTAYGAASSDGLSMELGYGYRNTAKSGQQLPVTVAFENDTGEPVKGFISIEIPGEGTGISYTQAVTVPEGKFSFRKTVTIPSDKAEGKQDRLLARFFDDTGEKILSDQIILTYQGNGKEVLCGVLSDDPAGLSYLGNTGLENSLNTKAVILNPADMPEEKEGLSQLDIIVISGFDMKRLSEACIHAVMEWVAGGGTLIIGTGSGQLPLGGFSKLLGKPDLSYESQRQVDMGMQYSTSGPDGAVLSLVVRGISWDGAEVLMETSDLGIFLRKAYGRGSVSIAGYDLCRISAFCGEHPGFTEDLLLSALGKNALARISGSLRTGAQREETVKNLSNTYEEKAVPGILFYLIAMSVFTVAAGTGLFYLLSGKGLGIYYPLGVLILSTVFALMLWIYSGRTRFNGPFLNYGLIREYSLEAEGADVLTQKGFLRLESSSVGPVTLELPAQYQIRPVSTVGQISITTGKSTMLAVTGQKQFEPCFFTVEGREELKDPGKPVSAALTMGSGGPEGVVENQSGQSIEGLTLVIPGQFLYLGNLEPGAAVQVKAADILTGPVGIPEAVTGYVFRKMPETACAFQKEQLMKYCLNESTGLSEGKALLLGFLKEDGSGFLNSSGYEKKYSVLFSAEVYIQTGKEEDGSSFSIVAPSREISGTYDSTAGCIRGSGTTVLEYSLGNRSRILSMQLLPMSRQLEDSPDCDAFRGQIALYNYVTASFDLVDAGKTSFREEELKACLSPTNNLTVRYIPDETQAQQQKVFLPLICIEGSSRRTEPGLSEETQKETQNETAAGGSSARQTSDGAAGGPVPAQKETQKETQNETAAGGSSARQTSDGAAGGPVPEQKETQKETQNETAAGGGSARQTSDEAAGGPVPEREKITARTPGEQ